VSPRRNQAIGLAAAGVGAGLALAAAYRAAQRHRNDDLDLSELALPDDLTRLNVPVDDGGTIHAVEAGSGRAIVLLHGVTLSVATWPYQIAALSKEFRVIAADARGHGLSKGGSVGHSIERMASDLAQMLVHLDLRDAILVGHSMGGMVTQQMCLDFQDLARERVAGTILMCTAAAPAQQVPGMSAIRQVIKPGAVAARAATRGSKAEWMPNTEGGYAMTRLALGVKADPRHVTHTRNMTASLPPEILADVLPGVVGFDIRARLKDYPVPALVISGSRDLLTPPRVGRELARRIPEAEFEVVPGAGHMLMMERAEWLNARIARFANAH
jgi:pimeloyl-ACP methyl ester carboxylesterase